MSAKKLLPMALACVLVSTCDAKSDGPIVKVYAYEREVSPGIPGGGPGGPPIASPKLHGKQYSIYLEAKDPAVVVDGVWMNGQYHTVETAVKKGPIVASSPVVQQNDKNVLVPATANSVIEINLKDAVEGKTPAGDVAQLLKNNAAVIQLTDKGKPVSVPVRKFEKKDPVYLQ